MRIHQFVHCLSYGDAISGVALGIRRMLGEMGYQSNIYASAVHERLKGHARNYQTFFQDLDEAKQSGEETAVLLHYSIGSPLNSICQDTPGIKRALIYHNLTPAKWYSGYNVRVVKDLRQGRIELPKILADMDLVYGVSQYNCRELIEYGAKDARVLPCFFDEVKWNIPANTGIANVLRGHGGVNILHVGRTSPNKCIEDVIKIFYFYHHKINKQSRLWLVGTDIDTEMYSFELKRLIRELHLETAVTMVGQTSDDELKAFWESADIYLCMSEHEGFCLPLLEAMYFGVPVIAFNSSAIAETLADGGILLECKAPAETAELIHLLLSEQELRGKLIAAGKRRVQDFSPDAFTGILKREFVNRLVESSMDTPQASIASL